MTAELLDKPAVDYAVTPPVQRSSWLTAAVYVEETTSVFYSPDPGIAAMAHPKFFPRVDRPSTSAELGTAIRALLWKAAPWPPEMWLADAEIDDRDEMEDADTLISRMTPIE